MVTKVDPISDNIIISIRFHMHIRMSSCNIPFYEESACVISLKILFFFFLKTKALKKLEALRNHIKVLEVLELYIHIPKLKYCCHWLAYVQITTKEALQETKETSLIA